MANPPQTDQRPRNRALMAAVESGDIPRFADLVAEDPTVLHMMTPWGTWLHVAASAGQWLMAEYLLQRGLDINTRGGTFGGNALNVAASSGRLIVVRNLLASGGYLDTSEPERNPLFGAIFGGHKDVVELLLESGIDAAVRYTGQFMKNMDAVAFADERGQQEIAALIRSRLEAKQ